MGKWGNGGGGGSCTSCLSGSLLRLDIKRVGKKEMKENWKGKFSQRLLKDAGIQFHSFTCWWRQNKKKETMMKTDKGKNQTEK